MYSKGEDMLFRKKKLLSYITHEKGFSLTEVIMATLILVTGILAYGKTSSSVMSANTLSKKESVAATLAQDKIEEIKTNGLPAIWVGSEVVDAEGNTGGSPTPYTRSWIITSPSANLWDVSVTVQWQNLSTKVVTLNTRITAGG
jgi:type II secretory pathway pseudopilin PulG